MDFNGKVVNMRPRGIVAAATVTTCLLLVLTACVASAPADDLTSDEVVGEWALEAGDHTATISMAEDGTFVARSWPSNLLCVPTRATTVDDLEWDDPLTVHGTWQQGENFPSLLILMADQATCSGPTWAFDVWEFGAGDYRAQVFLDGVSDPEAAGNDQSVWISRSSDSD
ncbi:hypothetical protein [Microbacterium sp. PMB16]|uniref:hypothetical protein n=1 Tax=Microbacterium sp. PMB16 TaxID=3120157 RepID=UPI003F4B365D